jgi:hypothetical protein
VRLIDLDDLDVNDDGSVDGIDEAIADARKSRAVLFGAKAPTKRRPVAGPSDRDGERGPGPRSSPRARFRPSKSGASCSARAPPGDTPSARHPGRWRAFCTLTAKAVLLPLRS